MVNAKDIRTMDEFQRILEESNTTPVLLCKFSPICPTSTEAENQFYEFLKSDPQGISFYKIDVIYSREASRGLAKVINIKHESPQALFFVKGKCVWHDSHYHLTKEKFEEKVKLN